MPQQVWPHAPAQISARTSAAGLPRAPAPVFVPYLRSSFRPARPHRFPFRTSAAAFAPRARTGFRYFCSTLLTNAQAT